MKEHYEDLLANGFEFNFSKYINDGWELFKAQAGSYIGYFFLSILLIVASLAVFIVPVLGMVAGLGLIMTIVVGYNTYTKAQLEGEATFNDFFTSFRSYWQILINILFITLISLPIYFLMFYLIEFPFDLYMEAFTDIQNSQEVFVKIQQWSDENWLRNTLVQYIGSFVISIINTLFVFSYMFIIDKEMKASEALWLSRKIVSKKLLHFIMMSLLVNIIVFAGIFLTCFLGTMVVVPLSMCINYAMYDSICNKKVLQ